MDSTYAYAPNPNKGSPAFPHIWDDSLGVSGKWRPYSTADGANINITGGLNVNVTGIDEVVAQQVITNRLIESGNSTLTGILQQLKDGGGTGGGPNYFKKASSTAFVQKFQAYNGKCAVTKVNGYSKTATDTSFIQIYDGLDQTGLPVANLIVQSGNNFYYEFGDGGVVFDNGITVANSTDPIGIVTGAADFFVTVFYKEISS